MTERASVKVERSIFWRREKVALELAKGRSQRTIANMLGCGLGTVNSDAKFIAKQSVDNLKNYLNQLIPERHANCITGLNAIIDEAWNIADKTDDERCKIASLSLVRDCIALSSDLITNSAVIGEAAKFIDRSKQQLIAVQVEHNLNKALAEEEAKTKQQQQQKPTKRKKQETVF